MYIILYAHTYSEEVIDSQNQKLITFILMLNLSGYYLIN